MRHLHRIDIAPPDPRLERSLRRIVLAGLLLVLAVPAARGTSPWFGAAPLWLLGMPLASWWALHHFRLPPLRLPAIAGFVRRRRRTAQARRRRPSRTGMQVARAA